MAVREGHCRGPAFPGPPVATMLSLLQRRLAEPLAEPDVAESRLAPRNQRPFTEFGPEVPRVRIGDNLAGVVVRGEALTDQFVETELLRTRHFDDTVDSATHGDRTDRTHDVVNHDRRASKNISQSLPGERVDPGVWRGRHGLMAVFTQLGGEL